MTKIDNTLKSSTNEKQFYIFLYPLGLNCTINDNDVIITQRFISQFCKPCVKLLPSFNYFLLDLMAYDSHWHPKVCLYFHH